MTEHEVAALRAAIYAKQVERDVLSDQLQAKDQEISGFPFSHPLFGPVPDSGQWLDHLRTSGNEAAAVEYDQLVAERSLLHAAQALSVETARRLEATLAAS